MMNFCADSCSRAKVCMLIDQHTKISGCDLDLGVLNAAMPDHLLKFSLQASNAKFWYYESRREESRSSMVEEKGGGGLGSKKSD